MNLISQLRKLAVSLLVAYLATGCALKSPATPEDALSTPNVFDKLVSRDVVSVLRQVDRLAPASTTLGTSDASLQQGPFAEALVHELQAAGYAMRTVAAGPETLPVSYLLEQQDEGAVGKVSLDATDDSRTVTVTVGDVAVRRTYVAKANGQVVPVGSMQVRGVDASTLMLDNEIFSAPAVDVQKKMPAAAPSETTVLADEQIVDANPASTIQAPSVSSPAAQVIAPTDLQAQSGSDVSSLAANNASRPFLDLVMPSVATAKAPSLDAIAALTEKKTLNILDLQQSNFESLFAEMGIVDEKVLTFANDSTRMGDLNKARLSALLQNFNPESDVLSVIGCSLGPTAYSGGQEGLALGRAGRVREEMLYAGIPENKILSEGCWAEETFDKRMPRRGVVVTLKRPIG